MIPAWSDQRLELERQRLLRRFARVELDLSGSLIHLDPFPLPPGWTPEATVLSIKLDRYPGDGPLELGMLGCPRDAQRRDLGAYFPLVEADDTHTWFTMRLSSWDDEPGGDDLLVVAGILYSALRLASPARRARAARTRGLWREERRLALVD